MNEPTDLTSKLKSGHARLISAPSDAFETPGLRFEVVEKRSQVAWGGNWFQPVWAVRLFQTTVCTVAPEYAQQARAVLAPFQDRSLLSPELLLALQNCFGSAGWQALEIFAYPHSSPPPGAPKHPVSKLAPEHPEYPAYTREFSGGTYAIFAPDGRIAAYAGVKDHGWINEIAVGTEPEHRNKGMGTAVVTRAVAAILSRARVPVYVPDDLSNQGSYALARAVGFEKVGEMLLWEVQR
jgi:RimJ/RimL family protein N-acetyltransferase